MTEVIVPNSLNDLVSLSEPIYHNNRCYYIETGIDLDKNAYVRSVKAYDESNQEIIAYSSGIDRCEQLELNNLGDALLYLAKANDDDAMNLVRIPLHGGAPSQLTTEENDISKYLQVNDSVIYYQVSEPLKDEEEDWSFLPEEPESELPHPDPTDRETLNIGQYELSSSQDKATVKDWPQPVRIDRLDYKTDGRGYHPNNRCYQLKRLDLATGKTDVVMQDTEPFNVNFIDRDESVLIYQSNKKVSDEWEYRNPLYRRNLADHSEEEIAHPCPEGQLSFEVANPSQSHYLLTGSDFQYHFVSLPQLYLYEVASGQITCLTESLDQFVGDVITADFQQNHRDFRIEWVDDTSYLFPVTHHGRIRVYRGHLNGELETVFDEDKHLTGSSLSADKKTLWVTYSSETEPSKLGKIDLGTQKLIPIFNPNVEVESQLSMAEVDTFWYENDAKDALQGWYVHPVEPKDSHPVILYIHGGPQVCYGHSFFHEMQYLAGAGYGVVMLNPRGGNGYGQDFVKAILGDYGNVDYADLMAGLDYVLEHHPEIDRDHLFLAGGSYGGFMTNWIIGRNDRFRAACTQRSISNWVSFYGTSDIGPFFVEFQLQHDLAQIERLWEMSPLKYASNIKTPLLILHGETDLRCPKEQAEQLYIALKKQRVDTEMVLFPQSSHGLSRNGLPNLRIQRLQAIREWFDRYCD